MQTFSLPVAATAELSGSRVADAMQRSFPRIGAKLNATSNVYVSENAIIPACLSA